MRNVKHVSVMAHLYSFAFVGALAALGLQSLVSYAAVCARVLKSYSYEALLFSPGLGCHLPWFAICLYLNVLASNGIARRQKRD